jgi:hypothetical protein
MREPCCKHMGDYNGANSHEPDKARVHDAYVDPVEGRAEQIPGEYKAAIETLAPALPLCKDELAIYYSQVASSLGSAYASALAQGVLQEALDSGARHSLGSNANGSERFPHVKLSALFGSPEPLYLA